jgi:uncharacterized metal-binding protein YceD (DUF177 family)
LRILGPVLRQPLIEVEVDLFAGLVFTDEFAQRRLDRSGECVVECLRCCEPFLVPFGLVIVVHRTDVERGYDDGGEADDEETSTDDAPLEPFEDK